MMRLSGSIIPSHLRHLDGAYRTFLPSKRHFFYWRGRVVRRRRGSYVIQARERGGCSSLWRVCHTVARTRLPRSFKAGGPGGNTQK